MIRLHRFLASKNRAAAQRAIAKIRSSVKLLESHPEAGRVVENMTAEFRQWPISFGASGYLILYRFKDDDVVILTVKHKLEADYWP